MSSSSNRSSKSGEGRKKKREKQKKKNNECTSVTQRQEHQSARLHVRCFCSARRFLIKEGGEEEGGEEERGGGEVPGDKSKSAS